MFSCSISLLAGICADGSTLIPSVAIPLKTIEEKLYDFEYTSEKVCYCYSESGFFSNDSFLTWAFEYFFNDVKQKRQKYNYSGECLLILDGFAPHENDIFLEESSKQGIIPFFFPRIQVIRLSLWTSAFLECKKQK